MKRELYDEICRKLTDYENPNDVEGYDSIDWAEEFYETLVKCQKDLED